MGIITHNTSNGHGEEFPGGNTSDTGSWTHSGIATRHGLAVVTASLTTAGGASNSVTATYGGVSMTLQGVQVGGSGDAIRLALFTLLNPPTGSQTVSVVWSGLSFTLPGKVFSASSSTYRNVRSVSGYTGGDGYGTTSSATVTSLTANDFALFGHARQTSTAFSTYNRTQRFTGSFSTLGRIVVGDNTASTGSVTSTATMSASDYHLAHGIRVERFAEGDFFAAG
jgi:hypothetical protein